MPRKGAFRLGALISSCYCLLSAKERSAVRSNLKTLFPDYSNQKINRMTREVFINFSKYLVDFLRFSKIDKDYIDRYVEIEGTENLRAALKDGHGVIVLTAHLGSWELGAAILSEMGFKVSVVALDHRHRRVNEFFINQRRMKGVEGIPIGAGLRRCFTALRENRLLGLAGDRDYFDHGFKATFFGKEMIIPKGPAVFSRRCRSPIVPVFVIRNPDDTIKLVCYDPIRFKPTSDEQGDLLEITSSFLKILEENIRAHPTQWFIFWEFWKKIGRGRHS